MPKLTKEQVLELGQAAGLSLDDERAETIASRLTGVLEELDDISDEALAGVEPAPVFVVEGEDTNA